MNYVIITLMHTHMKVAEKVLSYIHIYWIIRGTSYKFNNTKVTCTRGKLSDLEQKLDKEPREQMCDCVVKRFGERIQPQESDRWSHTAGTACKMNITKYITICHVVNKCITMSKPWHKAWIID
jgi:hypothetical protein